MKLIKGLIAMGLVGALIGGCASNDPYRDRTQGENAISGAAIGAAVGAGIGAVSSKKHRGRNAIIAAGIGAAAGGATGAATTNRSY